METDFFTYSRQIVTQEDKCGNCDVAHNRGAALTCLSKFLGTEKVTFNELSSDVMAQFKEWFLSKGRKETTQNICSLSSNLKTET